MLGIFLDTETNGLNPHYHKSIEIAFCIVDMNLGEVRAEFSSFVLISQEEWNQGDPESLLINGISWEDVQGGSLAHTISADIIALFQKLGVERGKAVFICQNPSFDRTFFSQLISPEKQEALRLPYHWLDLASMFWALSLKKTPLLREDLPWKQGLSKDKIAKKLQIPPEAKPHRAINGVHHLLSCYRALVGFPNFPSQS